MKDLETRCPGVAWDLLPMRQYRAHNWHCFGDLERRPTPPSTRRSAVPYKCSFCCIQAPFKAGEKALGLKETVNSYRFWSPQRVIEEIDLLVNKYGVRNIKFADEMFVLNARHVSGICDLIIERGYDLNIWAYARVDTVKDGMLDKLKRAGFNWLAFGIEAASDRVLSDVDKRYEIAQVYDTIARVKDAGINIIGNYIFGLPEDDLESMQETLDLALELELRVRQLLFGDGLSRLAAVSPGARQRLAAPGDLERLLAACRRHAAAADEAPAGRRGAEVPRSCLQNTSRTSPIWTTSSAGSAPTRSRTSARCRRTSSNASSPLPETSVERSTRVYVAGAETMIGAAIVTPFAGTDTTCSTVRATSRWISPASVGGSSSSVTAPSMSSSRPDDRRASPATSASRPT